MSELNPFRRNFSGHLRHARDITPGSTQTRDQSELDWVAASGENNRNRRSYGLRHEVSGGAGRGNDRNSVADKIADQCWQVIILALRPTIFDGDILTFDITGFFLALEESTDHGRKTIGRSTIEKSDHWHRRLLGTRGKRQIGP